MSKAIKKCEHDRDTKTDFSLSKKNDLSVVLIYVSVFHPVFHPVDVVS